ncbi:MAG: hypothetical protein U5L04_01750 [Trueperaceae bacterium]|nr:hypothetical protein [Trueperaceae bacterium]
MADAAQKIDEAPKDDSLFKKLNATNKNILIRMILQNWSDEVNDLKIARATVYEDKDQVQEKLKSLRDTMVDEAKKLDVDVSPEFFKTLDEAEEAFGQVTESADAQMQLFSAETGQGNITELSGVQKREE